MFQVIGVLEFRWELNLRLIPKLASGSLTN